MKKFNKYLKIINKLYKTIMFLTLNVNDISSIKINSKNNKNYISIEFYNKKIIKLIDDNGNYDCYDLYYVNNTIINYCELLIDYHSNIDY